jgi:hypothetical protein
VFGSSVVVGNDKRQCNGFVLACFTGAVRTAKCVTAMCNNNIVVLKADKRYVVQMSDVPPVDNGPPAEGSIKSTAMTTRFTPHMSGSCISATSCCAYYSLRFGPLCAVFHCATTAEQFLAVLHMLIIRKKIVFAVVTDTFALPVLQFRRRQSCASTGIAFNSLPRF